MGNASKKLAAQCTLLSLDEQKVIAGSFRLASRNSDKIREDDLIKLWGPQMDPRLAQYLTNYLFGSSGGHKAPSADFQRFAELYVYNVRGTVDERLLVTYASLGKSYNENTELPYQLLKEYCESIASTYIKILKSSGGRRARAWMGKGFRGRAQHVQALGESLAADVALCDDKPRDQVSVQVLSRGFQNDMLLKLLSELVFRHLYGMSKRQAAPNEKSSPDSNAAAPHMPHLLPHPDGLASMPDYPAFIDLSHIVWINSHLPQQHRHRWRFLFSTHIHGESFSTMMGRIVDTGPSVLIVQDNHGYIFGGYASRSWLQGPSFQGNEESFLFSLTPRIRCYPATGFNNHYMYLNTHQKTMPNGLMMGGQFGYAGIWLDYEFGNGASAESCSTFRGYRQLSKDKHFKVRSLEFWAIGDEPLSVRDENWEEETPRKEVGTRKSVLDTHASDRSLLISLGKPQYSDGFRG